MDLNQTPRGNRVHIALFGRRNAGKSSLINALTGQDLAIVSQVKGTTTDPVYKSMELLPLGPVVIIDTPGLDDEGELGSSRIKKAQQVLHKTNIALVIVDSVLGFGAFESDITRMIQKEKIPYLIVYNKTDMASVKKEQSDHTWFVSAKTGEGIHQLKEAIGALKPEVLQEKEAPIVGDLISEGDFVVLVVPVDSAAPKGRLILPQQQVIRDVLESNATAVVVKENELKETLNALGKEPSLVITDSQAFESVAADVPEEIRLTSFSILFARYKGDLEEELKGVEGLKNLHDGSQVLIAEGCTHHRQCSDIGTVKIPRWLEEYTGAKKLILETSSGTGFPEDLTRFDLIVHCGACMLSQKEMQHRIQSARQAGVPFVNYGMLIAEVNGVLSRSIRPVIEAVNHAEI